jgi:cytochrome c oxidase subunit 1
MATTALRPTPQVVAHEVAAPRRSARWLDWLSTTDHKKIGILYMVTTFAFFVLGGVEALLMRTQLAAPNNNFVTPEHYNQLFTMHGTTMIFLFVVPMMAGFANYFVPLMIGARDMAFPRLNALSYWLLLFGGIVFYSSIFFQAPEAGWFSYAPLSTAAYTPSAGQDAWIFLIHITGISSLLGAINFYATIVNMRAPGLGWGRLPLFVWTILVYSILLILALPVIAAAVTMLLTDRHFGTHFFDPSQGGSPLLWQHLFWFFGHPEVYIMILPGFGIISEVIPVFSRKPIFGYKAIAAATVVIAFLGMLVWAHHMFATPLGTVVLGFFMLSSFLIAVPTGVKIFNWIATLWQGTIEFKTPLLFAAGFIGTFLIGGITGIFLAIFPVDWQLTDTYFVVAHLHYVLMGGSVLAIFAGIYYWFPKITGRMLSEGMGKASFWLMLVGFHMTFLVQHALGLSGMPRRVYEYPAGVGWTAYNLISTIGSFVLALGVLVTIVNVARSLKVGAVAGPDPWKGNTLEWFTTSPPPVNNFDVIPRVRSVEPMRDIRRQVERATGEGQRTAASDQYVKV